jgi:uncharacterized surface protein with fasciclin (FAS1) repeats
VQIANYLLSGLIIMNDIVDTLINDGRFTTLVEAINRGSLLQGLMEANTITLFAPTDEAFSKLPSGMMGYLLDNPPELESLLAYHVIAQRIPSSDSTAIGAATTVEGSQLQVDTTDGIKVNDAKIVEPDLKANNGVIHVIDNVLIPASLREMPIAS